MGVQSVAKSGKGKPKRVPKSQATHTAEAKGTPVCIAALYCNNVVTSDDMALTIVQTLDTINFVSGTKFELGAGVEVGTPIRLVIMLKRDDATGRHELLLGMTGPSGETDPIGLMVQDFGGDAPPELGYNLISPVRFVWRGEGLYWLEVKTKSGKVIARTALRLNIAPQQNKQ
jgi:hypothetical protein